MPLQTVVFLDYQNIYSTARETFNDARAHAGQVDPMRLAALLVSRSRDRILSEVRVYRGLPDPTRQPEAYGANRRQSTSWERAGCTVITRPLYYPVGSPSGRGVGKGLDVALAMDFLLMAVRGSYERAILMSTDTDLKPALEAVANLPGSSPVPMCEVAAWSSQAPSSRRLSIPSRRIWCHWLDEDDYRKVKDPARYSRPSRRRTPI
jgi:uncharacterized LabA/DUF88 family protein